MAPILQFTKRLEEIAFDLSNSPEYFISQPEIIRKHALEAAQLLVKYGNDSTLTDIYSIDSGLYIDGMDAEQIWGQIELRNGDFCDFFESSLEFIGGNTGNVDQEEFERLESGQEFSDSVRLSDIEVEQDSNTEIELEDIDHDDVHEDFEEEEDIEEYGKDDKKENNGVDDDFFSMKELENFANGEKLDGDDDDIDYTQDMDDGDEDDENAYDIKYNDFFKAPSKERKVRFSSSQPLPNQHQKQKNGDSAMVEKKSLLEDSEGEEEETVQLSTFQKQQQKLDKSIQELEEENLRGRDWQMMGEVNAKKRPENSLLEETLEFEFASKPVPVITEDVTTSLETLITQRIIDGIYDDVERRLAPSDAARKEREFVELDGSKPSKSLADVYEDEFKKAKEDTDKLGKKLSKDTTEAHLEISEMFTELCYKLDALSNWHYTPKPPQSDLVVIHKDMASIEMEDKIPVTMGDAQMLAPQEVYQTRRDLQAKTQEELSVKEKTKLRNLKKKQLGKLKHERNLKTKEKEKSNKKM